MSNYLNGTFSIRPFVFGAIAAALLTYFLVDNSQFINEGLSKAAYQIGMGIGAAIFIFYLIIALVNQWLLLKPDSNPAKLEKFFLKLSNDFIGLSLTSAGLFLGHYSTLSYHVTPLVDYTWYIAIMFIALLPVIQATNMNYLKSEVDSLRHDEGDCQKEADKKIVKRVVLLCFLARVRS